MVVSAVDGKDYDILIAINYQVLRYQNISAITVAVYALANVIILNYV